MFFRDYYEHNLNPSSLKNTKKNMALTQMETRPIFWGYTLREDGAVFLDDVKQPRFFNNKGYVQVWLGLGRRLTLSV